VESVGLLIRRTVYLEESELRGPTLLVSFYPMGKIDIRCTVDDK
jgi:hypothetical protein